MPDSITNPAVTAQSNAVAPVDIPEGFAPAPEPQPPGGKRSRIPRVFGILAVICSLIGLGMTFGLDASFDEDLTKHGLTLEDLGFFGVWSTTGYMIGSLVVFLLHIVGAVLGIMYRARARQVLTFYGVLAIVLLLADGLIAYLAFPEALEHTDADEIAGARMGLAAFALPWPVIILVVFNDAKVRASLS